MYITKVKEDEKGQYIEIPPEYRVDCDMLMVHGVGSCLYLFLHPPDWEDADGIKETPVFLEAVGRVYPSHNISLRRIKYLEGHFVTGDEYCPRKRCCMIRPDERIPAYWKN